MFLFHYCFFGEYSYNIYLPTCLFCRSPIPWSFFKMKNTDILFHLRFLARTVAVTPFEFLTNSSICFCFFVSVCSLLPALCCESIWTIFSSMILASVSTAYSSAFFRYLMNSSGCPLVATAIYSTAFSV